MQLNGKKQMRKIFTESITKEKYLTIYGYKSVRTFTPHRTVDKGHNREFAIEELQIAHRHVKKC